VLHDGMPYEQIQGQGHGGPKVAKTSISSDNMHVIKRLSGHNLDIVLEYHNLLLSFDDMQLDSAVSFLNSSFVIT